MAGVTDFLFQGQPTPPQPTGSDTSVNFPLWMQQGQYGLYNAAANLASQPYTQNPVPAVATPSSATQEAWSRAMNTGQWQPGVDAATGTINNAANSAANSYGYNQAGEAAGIGSGLANLGQAAGASGAMGAQNFATSGNLMNAGLANTMAGAQPITGGQIQGYMNPYMGTVLGGMADASNTNFFQNVMPGIEANYVGAGQSRSPQEMQAANNAIYQSQQALNQAQSQALQGGYSGALSTALAEQQARLNAGQTLGSLGSQYGQLAGQNVSAQGGMGGTQGQLGTTMGTLANQNLGQLGTLGAEQGQMGALRQSLYNTDTGMVGAAGQAQDINAQNNLNAARADFQSAQQWPYQNLGFLSNIQRGIQTPTNQQVVGSTYAPGQSYQAGPLQSFIGTTQGAYGAQSLANSPYRGYGYPGAGAAKGGHIRRGALEPRVAEAA